MRRFILFFFMAIAWLGFKAHTHRSFDIFSKNPSNQLLWYQLKEENPSPTSTTSFKQLHQKVVIPLLQEIKTIDKIQINTPKKERTYSITLEPFLLEHFKLTYSDIVNKIEKFTPLLKQDKRTTLSIHASYQAIETLKNIPLIRINQTSILLKDIASIKVFTTTKDNLEENIGIVIEKPHTNAYLTIKEIKRKITLINSSLPKGVSFEIIYDKTAILSSMIPILSPALALGMLFLSILLLLFFFSLRITIIMLLSLIVSYLTLFFLLDFFALPLSFFTLISTIFLLTLTISITINTLDRLHHHQKLTPLFKAIALFIFPFYLFLLTLLSFHFSPEIKRFILTTLLILTTALLIGGLFTPTLFSLLFKEEKKTISITPLIQFFYQPLLHISLLHPKKIFSFILILFLFSLFMFEKKPLGYLFSPSHLTYKVHSLTPTTPEQTIKNLQAIKTFLLKKYPHNDFTLHYHINQENEALLFFNIRTKTFHQNEMIRRVKRAFNYLHFELKESSHLKLKRMLEKKENTLKLLIYGEKPSVREDIILELIPYIENIKGIKALYTKRPPTKTTFTITPYLDRLNDYGITTKALKQSIEYDILETTLLNFKEKNSSIKLITKEHHHHRTQEEMLQSTLFIQNNSNIQLKELCTITPTQNTPHPYTTLEVSLSPHQNTNVLKEIQESIANHLLLPVGYDIQYDGDFKEIASFNTSFHFAILILICLLLITFTLYFKSLKIALLLLITILLNSVALLLFYTLTKNTFFMLHIPQILSILMVSALEALLSFSFIYTAHMKMPNIPLKEIIKERMLSRLAPTLTSLLLLLLLFLPLFYLLDIQQQTAHSFIFTLLIGVGYALFYTLIILPSASVLILKKEKKGHTFY